MKTTLASTLPHSEQPTHFIDRDRTDELDVNSATLVSEFPEFQKRLLQSLGLLPHLFHLVQPPLNRSVRTFGPSEILFTFQLHLNISIPSRIWPNSGDDLKSYRNSKPGNHQKVPLFVIFVAQILHSRIIKRWILVVLILAILHLHIHHRLLLSDFAGLP